MIVKKQADNIVGTAYEVTREFLKTGVPSKPYMTRPDIVNSSPPPATTDRRVVKGIIEELINMSGV